MIRHEREVLARIRSANQRQQSFTRTVLRGKTGDRQWSSKHLRASASLLNLCVPCCPVTCMSERPGSRSKAVVR